MKFFRKAEDQPPEGRQRDPSVERLLGKVAAAGIPSEVRQVVDRELELLGNISPSSSEFAIGLAYLEYLASMPWNRKTEDILDLGRAARILNENHYGLHAIKERILEHLAVKQMRLSRKAHVLVVDDEEIARKNMAYILAKDDCSVQTAATGGEALERIGKADFDVVLTDLKMKDISGLELLERIKARSPDTQVILVTGYEIGRASCRERV